MRLVVYATWIPGKFKHPIVELTGEDFEELRRAVYPLQFELAADDGAKLFALLAKISSEFDPEIRFYELPRERGLPAMEEAHAWTLATEYLKCFDDTPYLQATSRELPLCWAFTFRYEPASLNHVGVLVDKHTGMAFVRRYIDLAPFVENDSSAD